MMGMLTRTPAAPAAAAESGQKDVMVLACDGGKKEKGRASE
jgi:hypothetical protein